MDRYAIIIPSDGAAVLLHCDEGEGLGLETLQALVGGYIETVPTALSEGWSGEEGVIPTLIVNEEGKLMGLPENERRRMSRRCSMITYAETPCCWARGARSLSDLQGRRRRIS